MTWVKADISLHADLEGAGPSMVLLHELGGSLDSFDAMMPGLTARFRVLRYDQRGAGLSEKPRGTFALDDHVADLVQVLAATGLLPPYHLVGVAAGCAIAVAFSLAHPDRVASLCLCCPALTVAPERRAYLAERSTRAAQEGMRAIADPTLDRSYPVALRGDGRAYDAYRARFLANDPVTYGHANMALVGAALGDRMTEVAAPCLVLAGRHDVLRPPELVEAVARAIPDAAYAVLESGHLMAVQAPDAMRDAVLKFIHGQDRASARDDAA